MDRSPISLRCRPAATRERLEAQQSGSKPQRRFREQVEFIERINRRGETTMVQVLRRRAPRGS